MAPSKRVLGGGAGLQGETLAARLSEPLVAPRSHDCCVLPFHDRFSVPLPP